MARKQSVEFEKFDGVMKKLLAVPYSELQKKLEEEKREKAKKKQRSNQGGRRADRLGP